MIVLVDTPVWSLALRRKPADLSSREQTITHSLAELIREGRAQIMGIIRQELLSGMRDPARFEELRDYLRAFEEPRLDVGDYEEAARMHNQCRNRGVSGSVVDLLVCSVAHRRGWQIFTTDNDFLHYAKVLPLKLYSPS